MGPPMALRDYSSGRTRHLVFMAHVWLCAPFMVYWLNDRRIRDILGDQTAIRLGPVVGLTLIYLISRTWIAYKASPKFRWEYVFPPIDVAVISIILFVSSRGPMSNLTLLYFLPIVEASGALKVRWAAAVGGMVVLGLGLATAFTKVPPMSEAMSATDLIKYEPLNVVFRLFFLVLISSLMAYQAVIAAALREKLGVVADRNRIAMEMHDGVQGSLISLAASLELIGHVAPRDGERAAEIAKQSHEVARQAADELRFLVQRLRAPSLSQGFVPALKNYAQNLCERHNISLEFTLTGEERPLEANRENALFRIAQEALNNVLKHSQATAVSIEIRYEPQSVQVRVKDNGIGFDPTQTEGQVGLQSMRERAVKHGGSATVTSEPGAGTLVEATV